MRICPKCQNKHFLVVAEVRQEWMVDENGELVEIFDPLTEILKRPSNNDTWICTKCHYAASGIELEKEEENGLSI